MATSDAGAKFDAYQKEEYGHIAEAHFKTIESISTFFRYYLLIAAVPLSVVAALLSNTAATASLGISGPPLGAVFAFVAVLGLMMLWYVVNLRFDALLYARQVNLIRKHFYDNSDAPIVTRGKFRLLPVDGNQPRYLELYFVPVVLAFGMVNSVYGCLSIALWELPIDHRISAEAAWTDAAEGLPWLAFGVILHLGLYYILAMHREYGYLRRARLILVDVDGVLNEHRQQFCVTFQQQNAGVQLDPDAIKALPVHRTPNLGVSKNQERNVFRDVGYWLDMPPSIEAATHLKELRSQGFRVVLATNRPWPEYDLPGNEKRKRLCDWRQRIAPWLGSITSGRWRDRVRLHLRTMRPIEIVTRAWLRHHKIPFDGIIVERKRNAMIERFLPRNRFALARNQHPMFCVEDDPINAVRLSFSCEFVFLLKHPYNESPGEIDYVGEPGFQTTYPTNVIQVRDWTAIYQLIRRMM